MSPLWVLPVIVASIGTAALAVALVRAGRATAELVAACQALTALRRNNPPADDGMAAARIAIDAIVDRRGGGRGR